MKGLFANGLCGAAPVALADVPFGAPFDAPLAAPLDALAEAPEFDAED
jgi:hypothetical protein